MSRFSLPMLGAFTVGALTLGCADATPTTPSLRGPIVAAGGAGPVPLAATSARVPSEAIARTTLVAPSSGAMRSQAAPGSPTSPYVVWTNTGTGERVLWAMDGTSYYGAQTSFGVGTMWQIVGAGDFSCDGQPDVLWRNTITGENVVWFMNGPAYTGQQAALSGVNTQWQVAAVADFTADNMPDIVWQNLTTGERAIWRMTCTAYTNQTYLGTVSNDWKIVGAADFTGDTKPDLLWQNTTTGERVIWHMNGTGYSGTQTSFGVNTAWDIAGAADFSADGTPDIVWQNAVTGERVIWLMNGTSYSGTQTPLGVVGTAWRISTVLPLAGATPLAPSVNVLAITQLNGSGQSVPANLGGTSGPLTLTLNLDTKGQTLRSVSATLACTGATTLTATQTYTSPPAGSPTVTLNSAAYDATTGVGTLRNGSCSLVASAATGPAQSPFTGNSSALLLTLANTNGIVVTNTFAPYVNAQGGSTITSATDADGFAWRGGSVTVNAMPVSYSGTTTSIAAVQITLPGAMIPTQTLTAPPYTATWSATATSGPSVNGIMLHDVAQTETGSTTPKGVTPAITVTAVGGGAIALPMLNVSASTFRLDNTPPQPPLTFMTPRRQTFEFPTYVNAFVHASYVFTGSGADGGIGATGSTNFVACGDGTQMAISNPPVCGTQKGVSAAPVSATTGVNGRTTFAYYTLPAQSYFGPPNSVTGTATTFGGCSLLGWTRISTANDLAETSSGRAYVARLFEADALGNARCTDLSWKPNVINSGVFQVGEFGVDKSAPTAQYSTQAQPGVSMLDHATVGIGGTLGIIALQVADVSSGFVSKPVKTKIERLALNPATGQQTLPNVAFSCPSGIVNGQCAETMAPVVIPGDASGLTNANGSVYTATPDYNGCAGCGYYTFTQTVVDAALNQSPTLTRSILIDRLAPIAATLCICGKMPRGLYVASVAFDNLDVVGAVYSIPYPLTPLNTATPFRVRGNFPVLGVAFDNTLTTTSTFEVGITGVSRNLSMTSPSGTSLSNGVSPTQIEYRVIDAAGNASAVETTALSAASFMPGLAPDFNETQDATGGYLQYFLANAAPMSISNCPASGCAGGSAPANSASATLTATVTGVRGFGGFNNPFATVYFYYLDTTSNEWVSAGYVDSVNATAVTTAQNTRVFTYALAFDPPAALGSGVALRYVAVATNTDGDGVSPANANIMLTNP